MICWFLLVPAGVPVLVCLLLSSFFSQEKESVPSWISWFRLPGAGVAVLVSLLLPFFSQKTGVPDSSMNSELHMTLMETCDVAVWGLCWCNSFPLEKWCEIGEVT